MTNRGVQRLMAVGMLAAGALVPRLSTAGDVPRLPANQSMVLRAARLLDPRSGRYSGPVAIRVTADRITEVIPADTVPAGTDVVDLGELTVLPGLIDAHVHLTIGGAPEANALATLRAGFTTVVDLGATTDAVLRLRDAIEAGSAEGPRILGAGLWVGTKNGVCEFGGIGLAGGPDVF